MTHLQYGPFQDNTTDFPTFPTITIQQKDSHPPEHKASPGIHFIVTWDTFTANK